LFRDENAVVIKKHVVLKFHVGVTKLIKTKRPKESLDVSALLPSNDVETPRNAQCSFSTETFETEFQSLTLGAFSLHYFFSSANLEDLGITFLTCSVAVISPFATVQSSAASSPLLTSKASFDAVPCVGLVGPSNVTNNQELTMIPGINT
jgi:hypothetical protein